MLRLPVILMCLVAGVAGILKQTSNTTTTTQKSRERRMDMMQKELGALTARLEATVTALDETKQRLEATVTAHHKTKRRLEAREYQLGEVKRIVARLWTAHQGQLRVAFSAAMPMYNTTLPATGLHSLVYGDVITNIGDAYSPISGYFTAPVEGIYYFSFTSFWWGAEGGSGGSLYHNGSTMVSWYVHSDSPTHPTSGSNSAILHLNARDQVNVGVWDGRVPYDNINKYSTFSGHLLFTI